jgi:hypothetical protein
MYVNCHTFLIHYTYWSASMTIITNLSTTVTAFWTQVEVEMVIILDDILLQLYYSFCCVYIMIMYWRSPGCRVMEMILKADNKDIKIHVKDIDNGKEGGWVVECMCWVGVGWKRGGMRRKRHQTRSKIINRLGSENQVKQDHVRSGVFHPWSDQLLCLATHLIDHVRACLR